MNMPEVPQSEPTESTLTVSGAEKQFADFIRSSEISLLAAENVLKMQTAKTKLSMDVKRYVMMPSNIEEVRYLAYESNKLTYEIRDMQKEEARLNTNPIYAGEHLKAEELVTQFIEVSSQPDKDEIYQKWFALQTLSEYLPKDSELNE